VGSENQFMPVEISEKVKIKEKKEERAAARESPQAFMSFNTSRFA